MWQKGLLVLLLLVAAGAYYLYSRAGEPASRPGASLVFLDPILIPQMPADPDSSLGMRGAGEEANADETGDDRPAGVPAERVPGGGEAPVGAAIDEAAPVLSQTLTRAREFDLVRIARLQGRSRRIETLEEALTRKDLSEAAREAIQRELLSLVELDEIERQAEGLIIARGLSDALVVIGEQGAEVIVPDVIDPETAGRIGDVVARLAGVPLERIVIVDGAPAF